MTLGRYLAVQALAASLMTLAVLLAITLALFLAEMLGDLGETWLPGSGLLQVLMLRVPEALLLTAPLALLVGVMMTLGDLAGGEELAVMRASGARPALLVRVLVVLAAGWMVGLTLVAGWVQPWAAERSARLAETMAEDWLLRSIRPGRFSDLGVDGLTLYVAEVDPQQRRFYGVFLHHSGDGRVETVSAREGRILQRPDGGRMLELRDGVHVGHAESPSGLPLRRVAFGRNTIDLPALGAADDGSTVERQTLPALLRSAEPDARAEWMRRLSAPVLCAAMIGFVFPVALGSGRGRRMGPVLVAIAVYLAYSNLVQVLIGRVPLTERPGIALLAVVLVHAAVLAAGIVQAARWWRRW